MKEITFLKQNAKKWERYEESVSAGEPPDPAVLTNMFIDVTDDLAYAQTNYGDCNTTSFLNALASRVHHLVYRNRKESRGRLVRFFTLEAPLAMAISRRQLLYSVLVTAVAVTIGAVSQVLDPDFVRLVLGDRYVDETMARIRAGRPLDIYGESNQFFMFVGITMNNIRVAMLTFVLGVLAAAGTALMLIHNGIMLGAFIAMFAGHGYLAKSLQVVLIHGSLEISAIILAGCAGFVLGRSVLFPGTYPRITSLKRGGKDGLKIMLALVPVFVAAGFLESFITRYTEMPLLLAYTIIAGSLGFIVWYFIIYPMRLQKKLSKQE